MKFGFPVYTASDIESSINRARKLGFDYIELDLNPPRTDCITDKEIRILENIKEEYNLGLAFHAPIFGIDIAHLSSIISEASMQVIMNSIKFAEKFNPLYFNLHLSSYSNPHLLGLKAIRNEIYNKALGNLRRITDNTRVSLTVENNSTNPIFRTPEEFKMLAKFDVNFCFDVGHAVKSKFNLEKSGVRINWNVKDWIKLFKNKILVAHLHDCVVKGNEISDHNPIGDDIIDFSEVFRALKNTKCKYVLIETSDAAEGKSAEKSIKENLEFCRNGLE